METGKSNMNFMLSKGVEYDQGGNLTGEILVNHSYAVKSDNESLRLMNFFAIMSTITAGKHDYRNVHIYNNWNDYSQSTKGQGGLLKYKK